MKKLFIGVFLIYALYAVLISSYLLWVDIPLEAQYIGTEADPQTFMDEEQLILAKEFSKKRNVLFFIHTPFEWLLYLFVLAFGLSLVFARWSLSVSKFRLLQTTIYVLLLSCFSWFASFPIKYFSYKQSLNYGLSIQSFHSWMKDQLISFWIGVIILTVIAYVIMLLKTKSPKKWWFYTWLLSIPFTLFLMFIQPVVIDPLYHDFYPIKDKELEKEILLLAGEADIPADRVYEVKMSDKTNALNAYVAGIGSNLRIVLWDTTLERLSKEEILFVMAHEMGHYDLNHLQLLLLGTIFSSLAGLYITSKLYKVVMNNVGKKLNIGRDDLASLPILLLIFSLLSFAASPVTNTISRAYEYQSDRYALELTSDRDAAVSTFHKLSVDGLSDVNPPMIVKLLRYTHPPMVERITYILKYSDNHK